MSELYSYTPDVYSILVEEMLSVWAGDRTNALLQAVAKNLQDIEDAALDLKMSLTIEFSTGVYLDVWGRVFGEPRGTQDDDEYRRTIILKSFAMKSNGNPKDAQYIVEELTGFSASVTPNWPWGYRINVFAEEGVSAARIQRIRRIIRLAEPVAVDGSVVEVLPDTFRFDTGELDVDKLARIL